MNEDTLPGTESQLARKSTSNVIEHRSINAVDD